MVHGWKPFSDPETDSSESYDIREKGVSHYVTSHHSSSFILKIYKIRSSHEEHMRQSVHKVYPTYQKFFATLHNYI